MRTAAKVSTKPGQPQRARSDLLLFLLIAFSLTANFFVGQDTVVELYSVQYFIIMVPPLLVMTMSFHKILFNSIEKTLSITIWAVISSLYLLLNQQPKSVFTLLFWAVSLAWLSSDNQKIRLRHFSILFVVIIIFGFAVNKFTDLNSYDILQLKPEVGEVGDAPRLSLYPNVAYSGFFSFTFFALFSASYKIAKRYWWILVICLGLAAASNVRAVNIALIIYLSVRFALWHLARMKYEYLFWFCIAVVIAVPVAISGYEWLYTQSLSNDLLSKIFFRSRIDLNAEEVASQVYRPLLWGFHFKTFLESDFLMGVGPKASAEMAFAKFGSDDTVAFLTKLLASYGFVALLFYWQLIKWLRNHALKKDLWACALFPSIIFLMMSWGSTFHPSDGFTIVLVLILAQGGSLLVIDQVNAKPPKDSAVLDHQKHNLDAEARASNIYASI